MSSENDEKEESKRSRKHNSDHKKSKKVFLLLNVSESLDDMMIFVLKSKYLLFDFDLVAACIQ